MFAVPTARQMDEGRHENTDVNANSTKLKAVLMLSHLLFAIITGELKTQMVMMMMFHRRLQKKIEMKSLSPLVFRTIEKKARMQANPSTSLKSRLRKEATVDEADL